MNRLLLTTGLLLLAASPLYGQDMPLSQILIPGEGWKAVPNSVNRPAPSAPVTRSPDGSTEYVWGDRSGLFIEARQVKADASLPYTPYCPLRVKPGTSPSVTALVTDRDGRIYATTPLGLQVFDPTGRLCGVVSPPVPGTMSDLTFEGDRLVVWIGGKKYSRKLKTSGVK